MKKYQQGFIVPLVLIIVVAITVGGGAYYYNKKGNGAALKNQAEVPQTPKTENQAEISTKSKDDSVKKPVVISFEAKARAAARAGECGKYGTIGSTVNIQEQYEYALFNIDNSASASLCSVDIYAKTVTAISTKPICDANGENCRATGALPSPRKLYESIPVYTGPSGQ